MKKFYNSSSLRYSEMLNFTKKLTLLALILIANGFISISQTTNISGVINDYTEVTSFLCSTSARLEVSSSATFSTGDKVLLIQMKGATIDESTNSSFGTVTDFGSAGLYEINEISSIDGNIVNLVSQLENNYESSSKVQLIRIPEYDEANVTGTLTAQAWNGTTGGVLIFFANDINLNADISASGLGFRGGSLNTNNGATNAFNMYYSNSSGEGGEKGEGIAEYISNKEAGKGPLANGAGGGTAHNNGGAGGGNYGTGGFGGLYETQYTDNKAYGGIGYSNQSSDERVYLGGGGGAGQQNNSVAATGAIGGGIIIIKSLDYRPKSFARK